MMSNVFAVLFLISIGVIIFMASRNYANIDSYFWSILLVIPIILLGYTFKAGATSVADARLAFCFLYLDSTILLLLTLLSMIKYLGIEVKNWIKIVAYIICFLHLIMVWMCKDNDLYYATFTITKTPLGTVTKMTDGPLKIFHYIYLAAIFIAIVLVFVHCITKKKDCSKRTLKVYGLFGCLGVLGYVIEMAVNLDFSILPFIYVAGDVVIALQYEFIHSHDIDCIVVEQKKEYSDRGYVAFDNQKNLLGYNEKSAFFVPEISGKQIDARFSNEDTRLTEVFYPLIDEYVKNGKSSKDFTVDNTIFRCSVFEFVLHKNGKSLGYIVELQDITVEQGYMNLIKEYGHSLEKDVAEKTDHIQLIQQKVVLGMATIVENRDMNTGGHVKRTSDVIRILVDEMRRQGINDLDDVYADEIIRSAPMHDLGKISIDNNILNKPGKLTDEEYAIMKTHSAKSGEIVKAILSGVEEPHFVETAYCLARFHHERWDGKGYPERLSEIEIPLEARIMAVADVYDALVSKRCYKEAMSFEEAAKIMKEGMGSQFDPMMGPIFEGCREQLETYYRNHREE